MSPFRLRSADVLLYEICDRLSGLLICAAVVFAPWAFGTTQAWSIWTMNVAGYVLAALLGFKLFVRSAKAYKADRWEALCGGIPSRASLWLTRFLAFVSVLLLLYIFTAAVNARALFNRNELRFDYFDYILWLPHSLDAGRTWLWAWRYLAFACYFWAVRDWLLGMSQRECRILRHPESSGTDRPFPDRLYLLLWIIALNGGALALEGIIQRVEGSGKLLFLVRPRVNPSAEAQFGPFAYRANAAAFLNLVWPVCLGFWWTLCRHMRRLRGSVHVLLACAVVMAACPIVSSSRAGALVSVCLAVAATLFLVVSDLALSRHGKARRWRRMTALVVMFLVGALAIGYVFGWKVMRTRLASVEVDMTTRLDMYRNAWPMARDYPLFGTGPGTFESVFQLYRIYTDTYWPAQLHDDWLETRITFGFAGSALIAAAFCAVVLRWFLPGGTYGGRRFVALIWLSMAGCLAHALYDFPFQIYSIVFYFLCLCAILMVVSRHPAH